MTRKAIGVPRCKALVYKRDTYRYTGRGKSGFEMHYRKKQCSRVAVVNGRCQQHNKSGILDWQHAQDTF